MAYATVADVHALNTGRPTYTHQTKPTASQVVGFLEQTAAEIDAILRGRGYALPVPTTATSALKLLEHCNAAGAAAHVEQGGQSSDRRHQAMMLWKDCRKTLEDGDIELELAASLGGRPGHGYTATAAFVRGTSDF